MELTGTSAGGVGVSGESQTGDGVRGVSLSGQNGAGIVGRGSPDGSPAGRFEGPVVVTGTVDTTHMVAHGNVSAIGNLNADKDINAAGDANVTGTMTAEFVLANGNISAGRPHKEGDPPLLGSANGHIVAQGNISALGNINAGATVNSTHVSATGNISAVGNVNATNMNVAQDIKLSNMDCAEEFDIDPVGAEHVVPGTVVVVGDDGNLRRSSVAYDKRAAGVVSGAGGYRPAIILGRSETTGGSRLAVALVGKVACRVDAAYAPIEVGDLLTTSDTPGHAMKATDPARSFGAVIGKALGSLEGGQAVVPMLVALQ